eukprot:65835-Prymnesium_polylepis.1
MTFYGMDPAMQHGWTNVYRGTLADCDNETLPKDWGLGHASLGRAAEHHIRSQQTLAVSSVGSERRELCSRPSSENLCWRRPSRSASSWATRYAASISSV